MPRKARSRKSASARGSRSRKAAPRRKGKSRPARKSKNARKKKVSPTVRKKTHAGGSRASATARSRAARKSGKGRRGAAAATVPAAPRRKVKSVFPARDLQKFRDHLLALRSNRMGDKESREKEALKAANQDVSVDHMADFGSDNYEQEFTLGLIELDVETLRAIEDALVRIAEGTYGLCEECGKKVTKARLKVLPHARLCVECKMKEE